MIEIEYIPSTCGATVESMDKQKVWKCQNQTCDGKHHYYRLQSWTVPAAS